MKPKSNIRIAGLMVIGGIAISCNRGDQAVTSAQVDTSADERAVIEWVSLPRYNDWIPWELRSVPVPLDYDIYVTRSVMGEAITMYVGNAPEFPLVLESVSREEMDDERGRKVLRRWQYDELTEIQVLLKNPNNEQWPRFVHIWSSGGDRALSDEARAIILGAVPF